MKIAIRVLSLGAIVAVEPRGPERATTTDSSAAPFGGRRAAG